MARDASALTPVVFKYYLDKLALEQRLKDEWVREVYQGKRKAYLRGLTGDLHEDGRQRAYISTYVDHTIDEKEL